MKSMKKAAMIICGIMLALAVFVGCGTDSSPVDGKKVAYIMQMAESDIFEMWSEAAETTAKSLGMEYEAIFCDGSDDAWKAAIADCAEKGYDGLLLSHGGQDYAYSYLSNILKQYPELKIVAFDTQFIKNGSTKTIKGVTQFFQQDAELAASLLDYTVNTLYADKKAAGKPVNILKIWVPDYLTAFDRRDVGYQKYEADGLINTVEVIGPKDFADAKASVTQVVKDTLAKYKEGEIDAIWCCYDLYAQGAYTALSEVGSDIPMVSVDICNADIEKMAALNSPWKACATTNWYHNGEFGMRVLALELTGEYDKILDPMTGKASAWLELPVSVVTQDMVTKGDINIETLDSVADDKYADRSYMPTSDWMTELR